MTSDWDRLCDAVTTELDCWDAFGRQVDLWLRDDDAVKRTSKLERLVAMCAQHDVPLLLAVIPERTGPELADWLGNYPGVRVAVHGYGHHNHAAEGEKSQELGSHRPAASVLRELEEARAKLQALYGHRLSAILVPPWNRIADDVVASLPDVGFDALSTFGDATEAENLDSVVQLNTHLDIIDWKGTRGGRKPDWLSKEFVRLLRQRREGRGAPLGVLTHHLDHDELAWTFLERLFSTTCGHPAVRWRAADDLVVHKA